MASLISSHNFEMNLFSFRVDSSGWFQERIYGTICEKKKQKRVKMGSGSSRPGTAPPSYLTPDDNIDSGEVRLLYFYFSYQTAGGHCSRDTT